MPGNLHLSLESLCYSAHSKLCRTNAACVLPTADLVGMVGGGWMIELTSWQTTFIALGSPQMLVALAFHLTVPSARPPRSESELATTSSNFYADVTRLLRLRTLQALFCASFFSTINGAMDKFLPSFYIRVHGMRIAEVGTWLGIGTGIVAGSGGLIGGRVIDAAYRRKPDPSVSHAACFRPPCRNAVFTLPIAVVPQIWLRVAAVAALLAVPLDVISLMVPAPFMSLALRALAGGINANCGVGANSAKMAVVPPHLRSTTAALHEVLYYFGASIGPVVAGGISDSLGGTENPQAIQQALLMGSFLPLFYAAFAWWGRQSVARDMAAAGMWEQSAKEMVGAKLGQREQELATRHISSQHEEQVTLLTTENNLNGNLGRPGCVESARTR